MVLSDDNEVLVVDDEEIIRVTTCAMLERLGFVARAVASGNEAIGLLAEEKSRVKLVILDMNMPQMDGNDVLTAFSEKRINVPVIISSGYMRGDQRDQLSYNNIAGAIDKPFRLGELKAVIDRIDHSTA